MDVASTIPHAPDDAPILVTFAPTIDYDIDDIDGGLFMLDRAFGGVVSAPFSKEMDPIIPGTVLLDGEPIDFVLRQADFGQVRPWLLGAKVATRLHEYGTEHTLHVEGFTDIHGNRMEPRDLVVTTLPRTTAQPEFAEHERIAQRIAEDGIVLLKNRRGALPLAPGRLNIFGSALHAFRTSVVGAGKINARYIVGLRRAIQEHEHFSLNEELAEYSRLWGDLVPPLDMLQRANEESDVGIVVLTRASGENTDNGSGEGEYSLTAEEETLIETVSRTFARTVVVLNTPYPIDVQFVSRHGIDALVLAGVGGMLAGPALLNVLSGAVNPSGRLPDTWALDYTDIPASRNFYDCSTDGDRLAGNDPVWIDTVYEEGIYVGYRYFSTFGVDVAFPFGHGLSYTSFDISRISVTAPPLTGDGLGRMSAEATVRNTGAVAGREVVQAYVSKPGGTLEQPAIELVGFEKTALLEPGSAETVSFDIQSSALASWDESAAAYVAFPGEYIVSVGRSSAELTEAARFTLDAPVTVRSAQHRMLPAQPVTVLSHHDPRGTFPTGAASGVRPEATGFAPGRISHERGADRLASDLGSAEAAPGGTTSESHRVSFRDVVSDAVTAEAFVASLTVPELARLVVCGQDGWGMEGTGVAGVVAQLPGRDIPLFQVADGNSGVNVRTPNIGMPTTVVLASTFDRRLAEDMGRVIGEEAQAFDVNLILAPALNLHRNPLNGRHPEYFSEDPLLAGSLAGAYARGLESAGVGACYKHLAANNAESARKRNQSIIPERALRELYLRAFEVAIDTYPAASVMTAYNAINGVPTAADPELIRGFLRDELGYEGAVMTDWSTYDTCHVVEMMIGGNNWITPGGADDTYTAQIVDAVESGRLSAATLRDNAAHLVRLVTALTKAGQ